MWVYELFINNPNSILMLLLYMNYINPQDHQSEDWLFLSSCSYRNASHQVGAIKTLLGTVDNF